MSLNKQATLVEDVFMVVDGVKFWIMRSMNTIISFYMVAILFIQEKTSSLLFLFSKLLLTKNKDIDCADDDFLVVEGVKTRISVWVKASFKRVISFCMAAILITKRKGLKFASFISKIPSTSGRHIILILSFLSVVWLAYDVFKAQNQVSLDASRDLTAFVNFEKANLMQREVGTDDIENVSTDIFKMYARATCVQGENSEKVRSALYSGLDGIPDCVRDKLVNMAVAEGVSQKNSIQDTITDFQEEGKAVAYKAFWSTVYLPSGRYESCLLATGVDLTMAETIVGWNEIPQKVQVATEPCRCGKIK